MRKITDEKMEEGWGRIQEALNSKEFRRFRMWTFCDDHVSLYQDFNGIKLSVSISVSDSDEHNWLTCFSILFWEINLSWNGRKKRQDRAH